jgi:phosphoribosyl 1,2-cyclic phosphate phosphodiesterase
MMIKDDFHLLIDLGPDLRQQLLTNDLDNIDAVCITHEHNDHVSGIDDIRPINFRWKKSIPIYTHSRVIGELKRRFYYAFEDQYAARPRLSVHAIDWNERLQIGPFQVQTIRVNHGSMDILGFKVDDVVYITDLKSLDDQTIENIKGSKIIIMSALHKRTHHSHQNLDEAIALCKKLSARQHTYLTHIAHQMGFHEIESTKLPSMLSFAYDGLKLEVE